MKAKKRLVFLLIFSLFLGICSCGGTPAAEEQRSDFDAETESASEEVPGLTQGEKKIFKYANNYPEMVMLDVHLHTTTDVIQAAQPICEPLLRIDEEGVNHPLLVEALPEMNEEGTLFTFKLKKGVKFHDGTELKAGDVGFTLNRIFNPATGNVNTWLCDMIKGGKEMLEGKADSLAGFKQIDDYSFSIELEGPYAPFLAVMAAEQMMIYPEKACTEAGKDWGVTTFIGTGPFKVHEFKSKEYLHAVRFDDYHGEAPKLDELYIYNKDRGTSLMEFEAGTLDLVAVDSTMVEPFKTDAYKNNLVTVELMGIISMNLNVLKAPLDHVKVREAISFAVDQNTLAEKTLQGNVRATNCMVPPGIMGHDSARATTKYDPEKAKALLAEAGFPDGIDLVATVSESSAVANVAVALKEQLQASGINLEIEQVDSASYIDMRKAGEVQVPFLTWYKDITDPDNFLYTFFHSSNSKFFSSNWNDAKTDEMMEKGRALAPAEREGLYVELENYIVNEQFVTVPLYNPAFYYLVKEGVKGIFYDNSLIRFHDVDF